MAKIFGDLERAAIEKVGALPSAGVGRAKGRVVYLTTDDRFYISDGTNWIKVMSDVATTKGDVIVHNGTNNVRQGIGSDGQVLVADATQTNGLKWTTLQQGSKNYITYANFENNATTGWSLFNTTLTSSKPTGSISAGAASVTTFAAQSSGSLAGSYSLETASSAAWSAGQGFITDAFSIDVEDRGKVMRLSLNFSITSGSSNVTANGGAGGAITNTFTFWVYDVTNSLWTEMIGTYAMDRFSGALMAEVQLPTTCTSARIAVLCTTVSAGAVTILWDDFTFGPREIARGSVVTNATDYSPTLTNVTEGAGAAKDFEWHRVGQFMEIIGGITIGTGGSASGTIKLPMPSGYSIDFTAIGSPVSGGGFARVGMADAYDTSTSNNYVGTVFVDNTNNAFYVRGDASSSDWGSTVPFTWAVGDTLSVRIKVPIQGWSSNANISSDFGGRIIAASAYRNAALTTLAPNNSAVKVSLDSKTLANGHGYDTTNSFDIATNYRFDVPETGYYDVKAKIALASTNILNNNYQAVLYVNGVASAYGPYTRPAASNPVELGVSAVFYLTAGQYVELYVFGSGNNSVSNITASTGSSVTYMDIVKIQSPQTLMGSEKVLARVHSSSTVINSTGNVDIVFSTVSKDTHSAYNTSTGVFTCPRVGRLNVDCVFRSSASVSATSVGDAAYLLVTNVTQSKSYWLNYLNAFTTSSVFRFLQGSVGIDVNTGDQIKIHGSRDTNHGNITGGNSEVYTWADFKMEA